MVERSIRRDSLSSLEKPSSPLVSTLTDFFKSHQNVCLSRNNLWQATEGRHSTNRIYFPRLIGANLPQVRALLEQDPQNDRKLRLLIVYGHKAYIYGQVEDEGVVLNHLYDFSSVSSKFRETLRTKMERGIVKDNWLVFPNFTFREAMILLRLAHQPKEVVYIEELAGMLRSINPYGLKKPESSVIAQIKHLREKIIQFQLPIKIITRWGWGGYELTRN